MELDRVRWSFPGYPHLHFCRKDVEVSGRDGNECVRNTLKPAKSYFWQTQWFLPLAWGLDVWLVGIGQSLWLSLGWQNVANIAELHQAGN